jgi:hypothetical protein
MTAKTVKVPLKSLPIKPVVSRPVLSMIGGPHGYQMVTAVYDALVDAPGRHIKRKKQAKLYKVWLQIGELEIVCITPSNELDIGDCVQFADGLLFAVYGEKKEIDALYAPMGLDAL